jgi:hypothetical protein
MIDGVLGAQESPGHVHDQQACRVAGIMPHRARPAGLAAAELRRDMRVLISLDIRYLRQEQDSGPLQHPPMARGERGDVAAVSAQLADDGYNASRISSGKTSCGVSYTLHILTCHLAAGCSGTCRNVVHCGDYRHRELKLLQSPCADGDEWHLWLADRVNAGCCR